MIENYLELKNSEGIVEVSEELYKSISGLDFFYHDDTTFIHINDKYYARTGSHRESIDLFCKVFKFATYFSATSTTRMKSKVVKFVFCCINDVSEDRLFNPNLSRLKRHGEKPYFPPRGYSVNYQIIQ